MKSLGDFKLKELKTLRNIITQYGSLEEMQHDLDHLITIREEAQKTSMNVLFNMDWWIQNRIFYPRELEILRRNGITNLQELIDCDLDQLDGMTETSKEVLDWARKFYDFSSSEEKKEPSGKK